MTWAACTYYALPRRFLLHREIYLAAIREFLCLPLHGNNYVYWTCAG